jgi:hypothetical protein
VDIMTLIVDLMKSGASYEEAWKHLEKTLDLLDEAEARARENS